MGDGELGRIVEHRSVQDGGIECLFVGVLEHIGAATLGLVTVGGVVVLELGTQQEVVDAGAQGEFIRYEGGVNVSQVAVGVGLGADDRVDGAVAAGTHHDVHAREVTAFLAAGVVLVGIGGTQGVVQLTVQETGVEFGGHGVEVLLLIVAGVLVVHRVHGGTAALGSVTGILEAREGT